MPYMIRDLINKLIYHKMYDCEFRRSSYISCSPHSSLHLQDSSGNDKVEEPLYGSTKGDIEGSKAGSWDLTVFHPYY